MSMIAMVVPTPPDPFSAESLRTLIISDVLRRNSILKPPSHEALNFLADKLNSKRFFYNYSLTEIKPQAERMDPVIRSAEHLLNELKNLANEHRKIYQISPEKIPDFFQNIIQKRLDVLLTASTAIQELFEHSPHFRPIQHIMEKDFTKWHEFAPEIAHLFRDAIATTNPDTKMGNNADSALVRFVAAVIPKITGEYPSEGSVSAELRRREKGKSPKRRNARRRPNSEPP